MTSAVISICLRESSLRPSSSVMKWQRGAEGERVEHGADHGLLTGRAPLLEELADGGDDLLALGVVGGVGVVEDDRHAHVRDLVTDGLGRRPWCRAGRGGRR